MDSNFLSSSPSPPLIIGAGLAGLTTALSLAPMPVIVLCAGKLSAPSSSGWAQGGVAAAVGEDDSPALHAQDTIKAGGGICDPDIVKLVTEGGAGVIEKLAAWGVAFDRDTEGHLQLGLEGAHSKRRIVHVSGDGAGHAIMQAIVAKARATPSIDIIENATALDLQLGDNGIEGVNVLREGRLSFLPANRVVLATGSIGALWKHTTNPLSSWGSGLALAAKAGAELADLEFVQFHPTAIDIGRDPMPLASEALRGEGAVLIDEKGARFMESFPRKELESRDVVSRAIWAHMNKTHKVFLDARQRPGANFAEKFPAIHAICASAGIDPAQSPIPVRPAAHYHMGGVAVDANGRSSVAGLWACGEVASTGLHGANRLASNSLLEAAFFGARVAEDVKGVRGLGFGVREKMQTPNPEPLTPNIRNIVSAHLGVLRNGPGLETAVRELAPLAGKSDMALVGLMIAVAAARREESRGSHTRTDYPDPSNAWKHRQILTLEGIQSYAQALIRDVPLAAAGA